MNFFTASVIARNKRHNTEKSMLTQKCTSKQSRLMWGFFLYEVPLWGLHLVALKHSLALSLLPSLQSRGEKGTQREAVSHTDIKQVCLGENIKCKPCTEGIRNVMLCYSCSTVMERAS